jgi:hypothetical protein
MPPDDAGCPDKELLSAARYMAENTGLCPTKGGERCFAVYDRPRYYFLADADECCECWAWYFSTGEL